MLLNRAESFRLLAAIWLFAQAFSLSAQSDSARFLTSIEVRLVVQIMPGKVKKGETFTLKLEYHNLGEDSINLLPFHSGMFFCECDLEAPVDDQIVEHTGDDGMRWIPGKQIIKCHRLVKDPIELAFESDDKDQAPIYDAIFLGPKQIYKLEREIRLDRLIPGIYEFCVFNEMKEWHPSAVDYFSKRGIFYSGKTLIKSEPFSIEILRDN